MSKPKIAIIGAGITGLHLARRLSDSADVEIFEKSRGIGGRMSTRRWGDFSFDHGAQYFTAHGFAFQRFLAPFIEIGVVAQWSPRLVALGRATEAPAWSAPRYVAVPGMTALCKTMAEGLAVRRETRVAHIDHQENGTWVLTSVGGTALGQFDWIVSTTPAEQTAQLMPACFEHNETLSKARMLGCYSLMLGGLDLPDVKWDAAVVKNSPIAWIAMNHSKPGRSHSASLLCQSDNEWSQAYLEHDAETVQDMMLNALAEVTGFALQTAEYKSMHKWRFAKVAHSTDQPYLLDSTHKLAAAGDWCGAGRVEAGFDSADALASRILDQDLLKR